MGEALKLRMAQLHCATGSDIQTSSMRHEPSGRQALKLMASPTGRLRPLYLYALG